MARQPIFDLRERVVGYELLHRSGGLNRYVGIDDTAATSQLLADHLLADNHQRLTGGRPAWVNFPASLILDGSPLLIPPDRMVVEMLETIAVDDEVVEACADLRGRGYQLAADDVRDADDDSRLLDLADIIKVDFRATTTAQRAELARRFGGRAQLLAEKVETRIEQAQAIDLGYGLLQGYYLREPAMVARREIEGTRLGVLSVLAAVGKHPMDFAEVEEAIKQEVAFTDKLLRYLNSAAFGWRNRVTDIRTALVALGEVQVRRWVSVVALSSVASDKPDELIVSTLMRARMCERLGDMLPVTASPYELFLTGLYSQIPLLIGRDMESTVADAAVPDSVRRALIDHVGPLWSALQIVTAWEVGDWQGVARHAQALGIAPAALSGPYTDAISYADSALEVEPAPV